MSAVERLDTVQVALDALVDALHVYANAGYAAQRATDARDVALLAYRDALAAEATS